MPDIAATRPVADALVDTAWGQQVHDAIEGIQAGSQTVALSAVSASTLAITFPRAYTAPPVVMSNVVFLTGQPQVIVTMQSAPTTTGVVLRIFTPAGTNATGTFTVHWLAIGTPA